LGRWRRLGLAALSGGLVAAAGPSSVNLLKNGGFEQVVPAGKAYTGERWRFTDETAPAGWSFNDAKSGTVSLMQEEAVEGGRFLRLRDGWMFQLLDVPADYREDLRFRVRARGAGRLELVMYLYERASRKYLRMEALRDLDPDAREWREIGGVYNCVDDKVLRFALHVKGQVDLDDATVTLEKRTTPVFTEERGLRSAAKVFIEDVTVPAGAASVTTPLRVGPAGIKIALEAEDGSRKSLTLRPFSHTIPPPRRRQAEPVHLPNAGIELVELKLRYFVRPNLAMVKTQARSGLIKGWDDLPSPLTHRLSLAFHHHGGDVTCRLDGGYGGTVRRGSRVRSVTFIVNPGSAIGQTSFGATPGAPGYFPIDISRLDRPGEFTDAEVSIADPATLGHVPFIPPSGVNLDLGVTARQESVYGSYTGRSAFDGLPESFIFTVPSAQYIRAWMLCAVENGKTKDPAVTARLTRFVSRGAYSGRARDCLADTTVDLRSETDEAAKRVTRVGSIAVKGEQAPLYLVEIPLKSGEIQDLLFHERDGKRRATYAAIGPYLDFELLGRLKPQDRPHPFGDGRYFPDSRHVSGVHVFAVTLEQTPVEMEVRQSQPGNIFHNEEEPVLHVALRPRIDGDYLLRWTIRDVDGAQVGGGAEELSLKAADPERTMPISLKQAQLGWYEIGVELWHGQRRLLDHLAAFALLAPDTRQAGYESPYATWWFFHHYGTRDPRIVGPLMFKAGFRRAANGVSCCTEAELAPWKLTAPAIGWGKLRDANATDDRIRTHIRDMRERYPHCETLMIFHESMPGAPLGTRSAPELFGLPVKEHPGAGERWQHATRVAKLVREQFPALKIYIGNSGAASELIAEGLRRKFPEEYADFIGIETVGRTGLPEKLWEGGLQGAWFLREIARKCGYDWPITSCFETNYRQDRLLGAQRQAEWYVRDVMLSHAYRMPYISTALLHDTGNDYHASFWGSTGLCRRYPLLYPKKAYVAMATVTRVLDRVTFRREVPTGSNSVYTLEFSRADGKTVYAVWCGRGTCELKLRFERGAAAVDIIDLYGRSRPASTFLGRMRLTAETAVQYLVTSGRVARIRAGKRAYPLDQPPGGLEIVNAMDGVEEWQLSTAQDPLLEMVSEPHLPFRTAGNYVLREVRDRERGRCLEVELLPGDDLPTPLLSEYAVIRLKAPVTLPGEPTTVGVWVKGNSGWGQVYWEIKDAGGVRRISCGVTVHDADVFDYDGRAAINYDGWAFLHFPITEASPIPDLSTGSVANLWESSERDKPVAYPITITGVAFSLPRQALHLTEMTPIRQVLRFKDLGVYE